MLKKIIALIMCSSVIGTGIVSAQEDVTENTGFDERIEKLAYLGITFDEGIVPEDVVTRAEFVRTLLDFVNAEKYNADCGFYDVDSDHPYFDEINTGANLKYMIGYPDGNFYPEKNIAVNEAVKAIVNALGYETVANQSGGYPLGYITVADSTGLLKGVETGTDGLTNETFSKLLENALECNIYEMSFENGIPSYGENEDINALWKFHNIAEVKAVVTANGITGLSDASEKTAGGQYAALNGETVYVGNSNVDDYLGYSVEAYVYYEEEGETGEVKYVTPSKKNVTITVKPEYIREDINEFSAYNFVYETETGRIKNVEINEAVNVIYNGVAKPDYREEDLIPRIGEVILIDNDSDGRFDCLNIFKAEKIIVVDYVSVKDDGIVIADKKDASNTYFYDEEYENYSIYIDGAENVQSSLAKNMTVLIGTNGEHSITYAYSDTIEGKISSMGRTDDGLFETVTINNVIYKLAPGAEKYGIKLGLSGKFKVDKDFNVYAFEKTETDAKNYAYFIKGYYDESETPIYASINILNKDNEFVRIELNEKLKLNGVKKEAIDCMTALKYDDDPDEGYEPQLILYKVGEDGKIMELDTVTEDGELRWEGRFYACNQGELPKEYQDKATEQGMFLDNDKKIFFGYTHGYSFYANSWQNLWYQDSDTIFFNVYDANPEDSYVSAPLGNNSLTGFTHDFYNVDEETNTVDVVIWKRASGSSMILPEVAASNKPAIVKGVTTVLDSDDLPVKALVLEQAGKTVEIEWNENALQGVKDIFMDLHVGDIIYYSLDGAGRLDNLDRAFNITKAGKYGIGGASGEVHGGVGTNVHYSKRSSYVQITRKLQNDFFRYLSINESNGNLQKMNPAAEIYRMTVRGSKVTVETISYDDVRNGDDVFCFAGSNNIKTMIVIDVK